MLETVWCMVAELTIQRFWLVFNGIEQPMDFKGDSPLELRRLWGNLQVELTTTKISAGNRVLYSS